MAKRRSIHFEGVLLSPCPQCGTLVFQSSSRCFSCGDTLENALEFVASAPTEEEQKYLAEVAAPLRMAGATASSEGETASISSLSPEASSRAFSTTQQAKDRPPDPVPTRGWHTGYRAILLKLFIFMVGGGIALWIILLRVNLPDPCLLTEES